MENRMKYGGSKENKNQIFPKLLQNVKNNVIVELLNNIIAINNS